MELGKLLVAQALREDWWMWKMIGSICSFYSSSSCYHLFFQKKLGPKPIWKLRQRSKHTNIMWLSCDHSLLYFATIYWLRLNHFMWLSYIKYITYISRRNNISFIMCFCWSGPDISNWTSYVELLCHFPLFVSGSLISF